MQSKVAEQVRRAAALTAELAAQSEKEVSEVCSRPPGLHDEAAAVTPQPICSPSLVASNSLQTSQGFLSFSGKFRERQPRSDTRAQEKAALVDETISLLAKVTCKDEASMRPKFEGMKLEDLHRSHQDGRAWEPELVRLRSACTVERSATNPKELTLRNKYVMCVVHRTFDGGNGLGHVVEARPGAEAKEALASARTPSKRWQKLNPQTQGFARDESSFTRGVGEELFAVEMNTVSMRTGDVQQLDNACVERTRTLVQEVCYS